MRNALLSGFVVLLAGSFAGATAHADESLRCGTRLVSVGDPTTKVRALCGEPAAKARRRVVRSIPTVAYVQCAPGSPALCRRHVHDHVEIDVEEWTYDFGPQRFVRFVTFEQGKVSSVERGDYGVSL